MFYITKTALFPGLKSGVCSEIKDFWHAKNSEMNFLVFYLAVFGIENFALKSGVLHPIQISPIGEIFNKQISCLLSEGSKKYIQS